jgi:hypothetical protein
MARTMLKHFMASSTFADANLCMSRPFLRSWVSGYWQHWQKLWKLQAAPIEMSMADGFVYVCAQDPVKVSWHEPIHADKLMYFTTCFDPDDRGSTHLRLSASLPTSTRCNHSRTELTSIAIHRESPKSDVPYLHTVAQSLRHYATNPKVAGSIPDEVIFKFT